MHSYPISMGNKFESRIPFPTCILSVRFACWFSEVFIPFLFIKSFRVKSSSSTRSWIKFSLFKVKDTCISLTACRTQLFGFRVNNHSAGCFDWIIHRWKWLILRWLIYRIKTLKCYRDCDFIFLEHILMHRLWMDSVNVLNHFRLTVWMLLCLKNRQTNLQGKKTFLHFLYLELSE